MARTLRRPVLAPLYVLSISAMASLFLLVGYGIDKIPLLPGSISRAYQWALLAGLSGLTRPVDAWVDRPVDVDAGGRAAESAP